MKRAIYVDYENVNISGLKGIEELTHDDVVKIFIGAQASKLTMVDANRIFNCEASVELITNKYIGKNALDFIIMVHMGYDIAQGLAKSYYIISKDKGYDPAIHEMRKMSGLTVARREDIVAVLDEKKSFGRKIKGILGFGKVKETPDTTEHTVVGKGKKDSNEFSRITKDYVKEEDSKPGKKKDKNSRPKKTKEKPAKENKSEEKKPLRENKPEEKKPVREKRAEEKKPVENKRTRKKNTPEAVKKEIEKPIEKPVEQVENSESSTGVDKQENRQNRNNRNYRNNNRNNRYNNRNRRPRPEKESSEQVENKVEETAQEIQSQAGEQTEEKKTGSKGNYHRNHHGRGRGRYNNRRGYNNSYHSHEGEKRVDGEMPVEGAENAAQLSVNSGSVKTAEKKTQQEPVKKAEEKPVEKIAPPVVKSPEEIERERQRSEAFALLAELDEQENNNTQFSYKKYK